MGKEIRNYEFKVNNAQVFFNDKGEIKYKGKGDGKKALKQLKPLFDAIAKADTSSFSNDKKVDSQKEKDLMNKLHQLLMTDGVVDADELKLGDEFVSSGLSAEAFINKKINEANSTRVDVSTSEEVVDTLVRERTWVDDAKDGNLNLSVHGEVISEKREEPIEETSSRPDSRVSRNAFNQTIQNQKLRIQNRKEELTTAFTNQQPVTTGTTLYKLAVDALRAEGVTAPTARQINERIAEIALINNISNVNNVRVGTTLKVGRGHVSIPATVEPSSITVADKTATEILTELEYTAEDKTFAAEGEDGFAYNEWTKEGSSTMYTTTLEGATLAAPTFDELKQLRAGYNAELDKVKAKPEGEEADEVKTARQTQNIESMKKLIELSGGDINVIKAMISKLRDENYVDIKSDEAQAFVQELIKTKNVEVLTALLTKEDGENRVFSPDLLGNNKTSAETLVSLYKEIRAKENAGEKLTDKEILLKNFFLETVDDDNAPALYTIEADTENGVIAKSMYVGGFSGETYYSASIEDLGDMHASNPDILDEFAKEFAAADTDDKKTALFAKYAKTEDKIFARYLAYYANELKASKDDVLAFVAKNDMYVLQALNYTPADTVKDNDFEGYTNADKTDGEGDNAFRYTEYTKTEGNITTTVYVAKVGGVKIKADSLEALKTAVAECNEFNNTVADRVVTLYTEAAGDPANMRHLKKAFDKIDATDKSDEDKQKLKDKILETYFEVMTTTEGESDEAVTTKHYTFKPSRRPTYEEMYNFCDIANSNDMFKAIAATINLEDMSAGQWPAAFEDWYGGTIEGVTRERYAELIANMSAEEIVDFIAHKMQNSKDRNIPYDAIIEKFSDNLGEQEELVVRLLSCITENSSISFENRDKLAQLAINSDGDFILGNTELSQMIALLPAEQREMTVDGVTTPKIEFTENMKKVFNKILENFDSLTIEQLENLKQKVRNEDLLTKINDAIVKRVQNEGVNGTFLEQLMNSDLLYDPEIAGKVACSTEMSSIPEAQRAQLFKNYINDCRFDDGVINTLIQNGWLTKDETNSINGLDIYISNATNQNLIKANSVYDNNLYILRAISVDSLNTGKQMYKELDGIGSGKIADLLKDNVNKDNVVGIIKAFAAKSPNEHLMQYIANESHTYSQGICSRVPKALMRKAAELNLTVTDEYKALAEYFGAEGSANYDENGNITANDTFKFTKNESNDKGFSETEAKELDQMLMALADKILYYEKI